MSDRGAGALQEAGKEAANGRWIAGKGTFRQQVHLLVSSDADMARDPVEGDRVSVGEDLLSQAE